MSQAIINSTKTFRPTKTGLQRTWYILDASKEPLGRVATKAASLLTGKNRADYAQDVDMGGMVVIINSKKTIVTGKKATHKYYFRYGKKMGSLKSISFADQMVKDSSKPLERAIKGMLPKNRHRDLRINNRLFIFSDDNHSIHFKMIEAN